MLVLSLLCSIFLVLLDYLEYYTLVPLLDLVSLMQILLVFCIGCVLDIQLILVIGLNCIACPNDHLLAKWSLQSFFTDCSCMIKICLTVYVMFITLVAFYLLNILCIQLVISLMKFLFVCECFRLQVYTCKCFTASRLGVSEFCHCSQTHI